MKWFKKTTLALVASLVFCQAAHADFNPHPRGVYNPCVAPEPFVQFTGVFSRITVEDYLKLPRVQMGAANKLCVKEPLVVNPANPAQANATGILKPSCSDNTEASVEFNQQTCGLIVGYPVDNDGNVAILMEITQVMPPRATPPPMPNQGNGMASAPFPNEPGKVAMEYRATPGLPNPLPATVATPPPADPATSQYVTKADLDELIQVLTIDRDTKAGKKVKKKKAKKKPAVHKPKAKAKPAKKQKKASKPVANLGLTISGTKAGVTPSPPFIPCGERGYNTEFQGQLDEVIHFLSCRPKKTKGLDAKGRILYMGHLNDLRVVPLTRGKVERTDCGRYSTYKFHTQYGDLVLRPMRDNACDGIKGDTWNGEPLFARYR
ncbi:MAG: hypothetical protein WC045_00045 [Patescibacteria group bacterium]